MNAPVQTTFGRVKRAASADASRLGTIIGTAFAEDAVARFTFRTPSSIERAYRFLTERIYVPRGLAWIVDDLGGSLWLEPSAPKGFPLRD
ncbi:MAG: hypothetical protein AAF645_04265, partial [Myxococcota bacterium]